MRPGCASLAFALALISGTLAPGRLPAEEPAAYRVIVNAANPVSSLKRVQVSKLFLERGTWSHGPAGDPVDLSATSPVRAAFSSEVLGQSVEAVQNHWRRRLLEKRDPPPKARATDEDVIVHVLKSPGAIGYVSAAATLPEGVRELRVPDPLR